MSKSSNYNSDHGPTSPSQSADPNPPTVAAFSPSNASGYSASAKQRSTIIVHKKSPLLVATPPQVTRALAHSHPFLLPLNKLLGLLSWTTQDPWESFLMVAIFWGVTLYGDYILRYGGPLILVTFLILGMYSRRYSPLSSTSKTGEKHDNKRHKRQASESYQHKSLDEIVETMQELTGRCKILLEPFLAMTDFLSTQRTATSATTRPALTTLFIRILLITPLWILLTCRPIYVLTSRRIILALGTIVLSWHSRPARITRVILWRSVFLRRSAAFITGLDFPVPGYEHANLVRRKSQANLASEIATKSRSPGVRFTFILYENQRRWIGLGWTTSLFAGERGPWTDEHLNSAPPRDEFELPSVEGGVARWRWITGSTWRIDGGDTKQHKRSGSRTGSASTLSTNSKDSQSSETDGGGWIYYDNKWEGGRNEDGWGRYTRRRKWYRDAELVEVTLSTENSPVPTTAHSEDESEKVRKAQDFAKSLKSNLKRSQSQDDMANSTATLRPSTPTTPGSQLGNPFSPQSNRNREDSTSTSDVRKKKAGWFSKRSRSDSKSSSGKNTAKTNASERSNVSREEDDVYDKWRDAGAGTQSRMSIGEDIVVSLG